MRHKRSYYRQRPEVYRAANARRIRAAQALVGEALRVAACEDCGLADPVCLEFHHVDDKQLNISQLIFSRRRSLSALRHEMRKCVLLCGNCHRRRTRQRQRAQHVAPAPAEMSTPQRRRAAARAAVMTRLLRYSCHSCGESDLDVMEFHHILAKHRKVSRLVSGGWSAEAVEAEMARCEVLCVNCHRRVTASLREDWRLGLRDDKGDDDLPQPALV